MKLGNTDFSNTKLGETMTFSEFELTYRKILKGISFKDAYRSLGGIFIVTPIEPKQEAEKTSTKTKKKSKN